MKIEINLTTIPTFVWVVFGLILWYMICGIILKRINQDKCMETKFTNWFFSPIILTYISIMFVAIYGFGIIFYIFSFGFIKIWEIDHENSH